MNSAVKPIPEQPRSLGERYFFCGEATDWDWLRIPHPKPDALPSGMLTKRQRECLEFIRRFTREHGQAPTFKEIGYGIGLRSKNYVHHLVHALDDRGLIYLPHKRCADGKRLIVMSRALKVQEGAH